ncbi:hypothetical protein OKQ67_17555 [Clostridioides difficile]|nr:hypothetical protein [Clostridioides difficile]EQK09443.1 hypothetical protein QUI_0739 [Clostridioides difficile P59]MCM0744397.1 hypothetical protein [Clostridioides difficile]MCP3358925.1 hypothetical protein [Clostridioides difficile]MCW0625971.1 hypothetical protein [Clostridioides difficile]MDB6361040.1 hypothetical protein [Clostridioides difficile]
MLLYTHYTLRALFVNIKDVKYYYDKINMNEILEIIDSHKHFLKPHKIECIKYLLKVRIEYLKEKVILYE